METRQPDSGPVLAAFWARDASEVLASLGTSADGLTSAEATRRLATVGHNTLAATERARGFRLLLQQFTSPIVLILIGATLVAAALGDATDSIIILAIVVASGLLGFWQEHAAGRAVDALLAQVRTTVPVVRDGVQAEIPIEDVVPGDVVVLDAGSVVPGDCRLLEAEGMLADESALTGESYPASKSTAPVAQGAQLSARSNSVFMGTHIVSGISRAVVVETGRATEFGRLSEQIGTTETTTSFERGTTRFGLLLVRAMIVLTTFVFVVNIVLHRPLIDSLLFSLALAVGLTPQLLPAIVAVSLARGAKRMATEKVIVKRLDAIEDFGAMTVLCTDKTGTITEGAIRLQDALDLDGLASEEVLRLGRINATLQRGFPNPLDLAIAQGSGTVDATYVDEAPYDFQRKRLSVLVDAGGKRTLITKGAYRSMLPVCSHAIVHGRTVDITEVHDALDRAYEELSAQGLRVIAVATRPAETLQSAGIDDETDLTLVGLLTFADPPKAGVGDACSQLESLGVTMRIITGDNRLAAHHAAAAVGLPTEPILTGEEIDAISDEELPEAVKNVRMFAEVAPLHKERIVRALRATGATVGFLGDGINDAAALHAADIGISVDTAVDVAKQTAAIVLLDKSLSVVADGIVLGRQTFANTLKYIRVTISANFGNVLSMAAATAFLPFLPLLPRQILLLNFLSDVPATTISTDSVDPEQTAGPERWDLPSIRTFMIAFGALSSVFDLLTFAVLRLGFAAGPALFRSGWFIESTATELAVMLVLRTSRRFYRSRPSLPLALSSLGVLVLTIWLPYSPLAEPFGLVPLPPLLLAVLGVLIVVYALANEVMKSWMSAHPIRGDA